MAQQFKRVDRACKKANRKNQPWLQSAVGNNQSAPKEEQSRTEEGARNQKPLLKVDFSVFSEKHKKHDLKDFSDVGAIDPAPSPSPPPIDDDDDIIFDEGCVDDLRRIEALTCVECRYVKTSMEIPCEMCGCEAAFEMPQPESPVAEQPQDKDDDASYPATTLTWPHLPKDHNGNTNHYTHPRQDSEWEVPYDVTQRTVQRRRGERDCGETVEETCVADEEGLVHPSRESTPDDRGSDSYPSLASPRGANPAGRDDMTDMMAKWLDKSRERSVGPRDNSPSGGFPPSAVWPCGGCAFINFEDSSTCEMCRTPKKQHDDLNEERQYHNENIADVKPGEDGGDQGRWIDQRLKASPALSSESDFSFLEFGSRLSSSGPSSGPSSGSKENSIRDSDDSKDSSGPRARDRGERSTARSTQSSRRTESWLVVANPADNVHSMYGESERTESWSEVVPPSSKSTETWQVAEAATDLNAQSVVKAWSVAESATSVATANTATAHRIRNQLMGKAQPRGQVGGRARRKKPDDMGKTELRKNMGLIRCGRRSRNRGGTKVAVKDTKASNPDYKAVLSPVREPALTLDQLNAFLNTHVMDQNDIFELCRIMDMYVTTGCLRHPDFGDVCLEDLPVLVGRMEDLLVKRLILGLPFRKRQKVWRSIHQDSRDYLLAVMDSIIQGDGGDSEYDTTLVRTIRYQLVTPNATYGEISSSSNRTAQCAPALDTPRSSRTVRRLMSARFDTESDYTSNSNSTNEYTTMSQATRGWESSWASRLR